MLNDRLLKIARTVAGDPGRYLVRFPFNLLPARWLLSERAMKLLNDAVQVGVSMSWQGVQDHFDELHHKAHDPGDQGDTAYLPGVGTVRACIGCGCLVAGGPTRCKLCVRLKRAREEHEAHLAEDPLERVKRVMSKVIS